MSLIHRSQVIICCLLLVTLMIPTISQANSQVPAPSLVAARMATSPFGTVTVAGDGFTPGGVVRIVLHDLWEVGPTVDYWVIASSGAIDESLPYLTTATYGAHGSQDPAQGYIAGTSPLSLTSGTIHGANGSQDPAQGYLETAVAWPGRCPDLVVRSWDARTDTWSNSLDIAVGAC
jgi:hypothetical protein